eukprot:262193-Amorphochlora_amoeboformis.AAC.1
MKSIQHTLQTHLGPTHILLYFSLFRSSSIFVPTPRLPETLNTSFKRRKTSRGSASSHALTRDAGQGRGGEFSGLRLGFGGENGRKTWALRRWENPYAGN